MMIFVRVRDLSTGHEYDVPEGSVLIRDGHVKRVKGDRFPPSPVVRPPKHRRNLAGQSVAQTPGTSSEVPTEANLQED